MSTALSKTDVVFEIHYNPSFVPRRGRKVNVKTMTVDNEKLRVMKNHASGLTYTLDEVTYQVWLLIDGKRTVLEIQNEASGKWSNVTPKMVNDSLVALAGEGLLESELEPESTKRIKVVSAFRIEVSLIRESKEFIAGIHKKIRPVLFAPLLWASVLFVVVVSFLFAGNFASIFAEKSNFEILESSVVGFFFYFFVVMAPVIALHEWSHGLALVHYGGSPGEIGTGLLYLGPFFYIDARDSWTLQRRQRIIVYMAGNLSTLLVGSAIALTAFLLPLSPFVHHFLSMTAFFCFYMTLWNLVPTFDSDGYYALADLLNIPNLRQDSVDYVKHLLNRALRRREKQDQKIPKARKKIFLLAYAVAASVFFVYLVYQTSLITLYMTNDVIFYTVDLSSMITLAQPFSVVSVTVGLLTIIYFAMSLVGYGVIFVSTVNKAKMKNLQLETVHDRDLSTFHCLPPEISEALAGSWMAKLRKTAKGFTRKFEMKRLGPLCILELRLGGTKWAMVQAKTHIREMEQAFRSCYQNFLKHNEQEILATVGIYNPKKGKLTDFLRKLANEASKAGMPEAKTLVEQIIKQECRTTLYLLHSASGTVCTIELPPDLLKKYQKALLPALFTRDLAVTDLYDEVEDFKKQVIYGFDSLASLSVATRRSVRESLTHPEKYQVSSFFEPIGGSLLFVGRTEEIEGHIGDFGPLFVCQAWYGYMDRILSETNLTLFALGRLASPRKRLLTAMKDGEITLLNKNLSILLENEPLVNEFIEKSEQHFQSAATNMENLELHLRPTSAYKVGLINSILAINKENMKSLPEKIKRLKRLHGGSVRRLRKIYEQIMNEQAKRNVAFLRKRRRLLTLFPFVAALSVILALAGLLWMPLDYVAVSLLAGAGFLQVGYWSMIYAAFRSFRTVGRYPSLEFVRIHLHVLALTEALHKFIANSDVLNPTETRMHAQEEPTTK